MTEVITQITLPSAAAVEYVVGVLRSPRHSWCESVAEAIEAACPKCSAHGDANCDHCSRITGPYLTVGGGCTDCESYGSTGMHWDTCAGRIRGYIFADRREAMGNAVSG